MGVKRKKESDRGRRRKKKKRYTEKKDINIKKENKIMHVREER